MAKKIILTIKSILQTKYENAFIDLQNLFTQFIVTDATKGLATTIIYIDDQLTANQYNYPLPTKFDEKACKDIVDHLYWQIQPEYLVVFGAQDVFPFQQLTNQLYNPIGGDPDEFIPSDLPYACDTPYSTDCNAFTNPTRVMGRLPDEPSQPGELGKGNIEYISAVIGQIIKAAPASKSICNQYFANSAFVWTGSTQTSLRNIFGNAFAMNISPTKNTGIFLQSDIGNLPHFFNLHGALNRKSFYGQNGGTYPEALNPSDLYDPLGVSAWVNLGSFVAAECCYGAQLLDRRFGPSIAATYLKLGAAVFMGSSTVSYGPPMGQGLADLITQYFMINILNGASNGRALLMARQKFLTVTGPTLDFHELKTIAQFYILGDPSLQPVESTIDLATMNTIEDRRFSLIAKGIGLGLSIPNTQKIDEQLTKGIFSDFSELPDEIKENFKFVNNKTIFEVDDDGFTGFNFAKAMMSNDNVSLKTRFHVYQVSKIMDDGIFDLKALVVKERSNKIVGYREYSSK